MPTPTAQLLSQTRYATDGITTDWDFSFSGGYLLKSHVKALTETPEGSRNEITVIESMLTGPFTLRITPALAAGNVLIIYRDTPKDLPLVDFTDESGFSEVSLDTNAKQAVFIAAEAIDIINTSSPYEAEEAASKAGNSAFAAAASALAAANSASQSAASASASEDSADDAALSATAAYNSAVTASASAQAVFNANTTSYIRTLLDDADAAAARATLWAAAGNGSGQANALNPANSYSVTNLTASSQIAAPYYYSPGVGYFGTATNNSINFVTNNVVRATLDSGGNFSASSYSGAGTGLTGTAASLTAGAANNAIGHGQTWANAGLVAGTGYTNTYGRPIAIMIAASGGQSITMTIGGYTFPVTGTFANDVSVFTFIIPTGAAYSFTGTAVAWSARLS